MDSLMKDMLFKRAMANGEYERAKMILGCTDPEFDEVKKAWSEAARAAAAAARRGGGEAGPSTLKNEKWVSKDGFNNAEIKIEGDKLSYSDYNESKAEGESLTATKVGGKYKIDAKNDLGAFDGFEVGRSYPVAKVAKRVKENFEASKKAFA